MNNETMVPCQPIQIGTAIRCKLIRKPKSWFPWRLKFEKVFVFEQNGCDKRLIMSEAQVAKQMKAILDPVWGSDRKLKLTDKDIQYDLINNADDIAKLQLKENKNV